MLSPSFFCKDSELKTQVLQNCEENRPLSFSAAKWVVLCFGSQRKLTQPFVEFNTTVKRQTASIKGWEAEQKNKTAEWKRVIATSLRVKARKAAFKINQGFKKQEWRGGGMGIVLTLSSKQFLHIDTKDNFIQAIKIKVKCQYFQISAQVSLTHADDLEGHCKLP